MSPHEVSRYDPAKSHSMRWNVVPLFLDEKRTLVPQLSQMNTRALLTSNLLSSFGNIAGNLVRYRFIPPWMVLNWLLGWFNFAWQAATSAKKLWITSVSDCCLSNSANLSGSSVWASWLAAEDGRSDVAYCAATVSGIKVAAPVSIKHANIKPSRPTCRRSACCTNDVIRGDIGHAFM